MTESGRSGRSRLRAWIARLHFYLSLAWLGLVLFFAGTGFLLAHGDWVGLDEISVTVFEGRLSLNLEAEPDRAALEKILREEHGASGILEDFVVAEDELRLVFRRPGRLTEAVIDRADGALELTTESGGFWAALADIHRGEHTGPAGRWLLDLAAVTLLVVSLTGLLLWLTRPGRRLRGLVAVLAGAIALALLFLAAAR